MLCDRMPLRLELKLYRTVVRSAMISGVETWATTKKEKKRLDVNEKRINIEMDVWCDMER